jgi:hypothetical protein
MNHPYYTPMEKFGMTDEYVKTYGDSYTIV